MEVAGVDGCDGGWLVVRAEVRENLPLELKGDPFRVETFNELVAVTRHCKAVAIDIPIGLTQGPERSADKAARAMLGEPRARSVFRAPCWPVLDGTTDETAFEDVCQVSRKHCLRKDGKPAAMSQQSWRIMPKVREVNLAMSPDLQNRIVEVHPEVSFCALARRPMNYRKKSSKGKRDRAVALATVFDREPAGLSAPQGAARDDLYDACAAAWTARRFARGEAKSLPPDPPVDSCGLRMEIVY